MNLNSSITHRDGLSRNTPPIGRLIMIAAMAVVMMALVLPIGGCDLGSMGMFGGPGNDPALAKQTLIERLDTLEARKDSVDSVIDSLRLRIADYQTRLDAIPDDGQLADQIRDAITRVDAELGRAQAFKEQADAAIADAQQRIDAINDDPAQGATGTTVGIDGIAGAVQSTGALLPPPWNTGATVIGFALAGIADFLRRKQKKNTETELRSQDEAYTAMLNSANQELRTVVYAIDTVAKADPELKARIKAKGEVLETIYGPELNTKVNAMRAK